jgi:hypothetical protein
MAEPEDRIRALRFPPALPWGPTGPNTNTLREDISRWYEPAGGIDKAVAAAQQAMQKTDAPFQPWDVKDLDRKIPMEFTEMPAGSNGRYMPDRKVVQVNRDEPPSQYTLEHERSHSVFGPDQYQSPGISDTGTRFLGKRNTAYITQPGEIDVRLANIKRHYAYNTGKIVTTPQEAEEALKWWGRNSDDFEKEVPEAERPAYLPKKEAGTYLLLPDEQKMKVLRRMPELVNSNLIERLGQYG